MIIRIDEIVSAQIARPSCAGLGPIQAVDLMTFFKTSS
jgi:hypothetical protein